MKKVAFFMRSAQGGGAERVMISVANSFLEKGYDVDFIFVHAEGPFIKEIHKNINIIDLKSKRAIYSLFKFYFYLLKNKPNTLISALNYINLIAIFSCFFIVFNRPKVIVTEHGTLSAVTKDLEGTGKIVPKLMKLLYPYAQKIVCVSNGVADDLADQLNIDRENINTIYNPIDFEYINNKKDLPLIHPWVGTDIPIILGAGRLVDVKNFPLLINAFLKVRAKVNCRLVIIGEGEKRKDLELLITASPFPDDILLYGFTDNPYQWMKAAKVFVLSSNTEGLPTVLIEALACGVKVISTDCPYGPREILDNGRYGVLVEVGNIDELASTIVNSLTDNMQNSCRISFDKYRLESVFENYEKIISDEKK
ncbi:glycosyltransferase [Acinetobacter oleivorans]|uniref:glycosyltransferase n=1 Tax=Acinetobacter oleivorans TaxID=1148157 RepID=UPI00226D1943|nr:glycosyltransferase [Acinetobacter oleivorans]